MVGWCSVCDQRQHPPHFSILSINPVFCRYCANPLVGLQTCRATSEMNLGPKIDLLRFAIRSEAQICSDCLATHSH